MFFQNKHFEINIQNDTQTVESKLYMGFLDSEQLRLLKQKLLEAINYSGFDKLITDFQNLKVIAPTDQDWLIREWFPRAEFFGLKKFAFINSSDTFGNYALKRIVNEAKINDLFIKEFHSIEAAQSCQEFNK